MRKMSSASTSGDKTKASSTETSNEDGRIKACQTILVMLPPVPFAMPMA